MPDWINNSHADFVLAAYLIALSALLGFLLLSWMGYRKKDKAWQQKQKDQQGQGS